MVYLFTYLFIYSFIWTYWLYSSLSSRQSSSLKGFNIPYSGNVVWSFYESLWSKKQTQSWISIQWRSHRWYEREKCGLSIILHIEQNLRSKSISEMNCGSINKSKRWIYKEPLDESLTSTYIIWNNVINTWYCRRNDLPFEEVQSLRLRFY